MHFASASALQRERHHDAGFDVRNGAAMDPARILFLKMKPKDAKVFQVKLEGGQILVEV